MAKMVDMITMSNAEEVVYRRDFCFILFSGLDGEGLVYQIGA
jgi:hypothetical protein